MVNWRKKNKVAVICYSRTVDKKFLVEKLANELMADIEEVLAKWNRLANIIWSLAGSLQLTLKDV